MMDSNEPPIIKYEVVPGKSDPDDDSKETEEDSSSSSDEESAGDDAGIAVVQNEITENILDFLFAPKRVEGGMMRMSRQPVSRAGVQQLGRTFEECVRERQVRMRGFCPVRRELYDMLFDELIRQCSLDCAERGSLLLRVRDEFRMRMEAHRRLLESGAEFGARKALQADAELAELRAQHSRLSAEADRAEKRVSELRAQADAEELLSRQSVEGRRAAHEERMRFLKQLNTQLKEQMSYIK